MLPPPRYSARDERLWAHNVAIVDAKTISAILGGEKEASDVRD